MAHFYYSDISPDTFKIAPNRVLVVRRGQVDIPAHAYNHNAIRLRFILNGWHCDTESNDLVIYTKDYDLCVINKKLNTAQIYKNKLRPLIYGRSYKITCVRGLIVIMVYKSSTKTHPTILLTILDSDCNLIIHQKCSRADTYDDAVIFVRYFTLYIVNADGKINRSWGFRTVPVTYKNRCAMYFRGKDGIVSYPDIINKPKHKIIYRNAITWWNSGGFVDRNHTTHIHDGKMWHELPASMEPNIMTRDKLYRNRSMKFICNNHLVYNDKNNNIQSVDLKTLERKCIGKNIANYGFATKGHGVVNNDIAISNNVGALYTVTSDACYKIISDKYDNFKRCCVVGGILLAQMSTGFEIYTIKGKHICTICYNFDECEWDFDDRYLSILKLNRAAGRVSIGYLVDAHIY